MFGGYADRAELEDELYAEETGGSEGDDSELEFRLYSQLHYSSNPGEREEVGDRHLSSSHGEEEEEEEVGDRRLSSSHGEKEEVGDRRLSFSHGEKEEEVGDRRLSSSHGEKEEEVGDRRLSSSHGEKEEEEDGSKAKRQRPPLSNDHSNRDLRQNLLGDTEQKQQKVKLKTQQGRKRQRGLSKGDPRRQRLFQEVIVIDSSQDDVITVSDNTEEDDGVCSLKGQRLKKGPLQASTPGQQRNPAPKKGRSSVGSDSVVVLDSGSGAKSGLDSDSDSLESWMILDSGKQDGDQGIILNLEGEGDIKDGDEGTWVIADRDREAQIVNRRGGGPRGKRVANRYYADKNVTCHSCKRTGHLSTSCPTPPEPCCVLCGERGHTMLSCPSKHCRNCGLPGHLNEVCVVPNLRYKLCYRCGVQGHLNDACPEIWRQYHITTKSGPVLVVKGEDNARTNPCCYNCSLRGHFGFDCSVRRMFAGFPPNSPFINQYDSRLSIRNRDYRAQLRVQELKDAGLFPCQVSPDRDARDDPPGKRQRTDSNPSYRPYQNYPPKTYHSATPDRTHIRFSGGQEKPWTPKHKLKESREGKGFTPASATPKSNMADRNQPGSQERQKKKQRKLAKNKMAAAADESLDFPRGQGPSTKRKKKGPKGPPPSAGAPPTFHPKGPASHTPDRLFGAAKKGASKKKKRENGRDRKAAKEEKLFPTDENLFLIKQRKPRR
ncbi:zinc finger CCHC domain-containing protein 7-like isoform X2 [Oncorhynchus clarkii lewisi]|uniref:zinc finger CCHC domain-containing protein 7-like isoform X1 n=1 Tax=Oncorhynchus clarkii lewisi TaxID=490388 RepID=UPI0039B855E9